MAKEPLTDSRSHICFMDLPPELRIRIYELSFNKITRVGRYYLGPDGISKTVLKQESWNRFPALLAVSRQIRFEAIQEFTNRTTFAFSISINTRGTSNTNTSGTEFVRFLQDDIKPIKLEDMKKVTVEIRDHGIRKQVPMSPRTLMICWHGKCNQRAATVRVSFIDVLFISMREEVMKSPWFRKYALGRCLGPEDYREHACSCSTKAFMDNTSLEAILDDAINILVGWGDHPIFYQGRGAR